MGRSDYRDIQNEPVSIPKDATEDEEKAYIEAKEKHLRRSRNNAGKEAMTRELKHQVAILPDEFDSDDMLFNAQNGYLDLSNGILYEHDISKMFTEFLTLSIRIKVIVHVGSCF